METTALPDTLTPPPPSHRYSGVKYNRLWYAALALVTLVLFTVAVGAVVFMALYYTHSEACLLNKIFLSTNASLCFLVSLLAISPCIQKRKGYCTHTHQHVHKDAHT